MSARLAKDMEEAVAAAFKEAGVSHKTAVPASRLASAAICEYLMGLRATFSQAACKYYRDRAIYEQRRAGSNFELAKLEDLSDRRIRQIIYSLHQKRRTKKRTA